MTGYMGKSDQLSRSQWLKPVFWLGIFMAALCAWPVSSLALPLEQIKLPPGFHISIFADNVRDARSMTLSPSGTLFVGTRSAGNVYAIVVRNGADKADGVIT